MAEGPRKPWTAPRIGGYQPGGPAPENPTPPKGPGVVPRVPPEARAQSTDELLTAFAHLTHKIHALEQDHGKDASVDERAKRDIIKREILRRCGEL